MALVILIDGSYLDAREGVKGMVSRVGIKTQDWSRDFGSGTPGRAVSIGRYMYIHYTCGYNGYLNSAGGAFSANVTFN